MNVKYVLGKQTNVYWMQVMVAMVAIWLQYGCNMCSSSDSASPKKKVWCWI